MTDTSVEMDGRAAGAARQPRRDSAARRVMELEAENAALRRALAEAGLAADRVGRSHDAELSRGRAGRADDALEARSAAARAEARHGREVATGRTDLASSERANGALRRANAELAASRAALREREERLRLILASATDYAIFTTDLDRRVTSWNEGAARLLGWAEEEIVGRSADAIFTPEDRGAGAPEQEAEGALRDGRAADERWHQRKDGSRFWANGLMLPLRDPDAGPAARPLGFLKIMRDETGRRRAEEALHRSEARWRGAFERMHEGFALCETVHGPGGEAVDFRYLEVNAAWERLTGVPAAATVGRLAGEVFPGVEEFWVRTYARVVETGEPAHVEHRLGPVDRWFEVLAYRTEPGRFAALFLNVTARKRAEERLREGEARWRGLFETMQEGFALCEVVHGPDGEAVDFRHIEVNAAWERHTGIPRAAAQGRLVSELVPAEEAAFWIETYARVVETGEPARAEHHTPSLRRWFEALAYRTEPGRFAFLFSDVTGRKAAEARRDALLELGERLRDFRDPGEIAHAAAEVIGRALGASRAGYGPVDEGETLRVERDWTGGTAASVAGEWNLAEYWTGISGDLRRGEVVAIDDVGRDPRTAAYAEALHAIGVHAQIVVPVVERGRVSAILFVHDAAPRGWTAEEVAFVRGAADRAWAVAERARAEEELRAEKARLRLALDASRLGAWELDVAADSAARSPRHDAIFGYEAPPPVWGFEQFMRHVLPEDRGHVERSFRAAVEGGGEWHFECRIHRAGDGEER